MAHPGYIETIERHYRRRAAAIAQAVWEAPSVIGSWLWALFRVWQRRAEARHALSRLEGWQLDDVGLDRAAAEREAAKPFWRS